MKKDNMMLGFFLVLGGLALLVNKMGYFGDINVFSVVIAIFLVCIFLKSLFKLNFAGILFPLAFIGILFDEQLGITAVTPWTVLLAATLGSIGLSLLFPKKSNKLKASITWDKERVLNDVEEDSNNIKIQSSFTESIKYINTDKLQTALLKSRFGALRIYFDNAKLDNGRATVELDITFSGAELFVPKDWIIDNKASVAFGAIEEKNRSIGTGENILTLVGNVSFSGVEIVYV